MRSDEDWKVPSAIQSQSAANSSPFAPGVIEDVVRLFVLEPPSFDAPTESTGVPSTSAPVTT